MNTFDVIKERKSTRSYSTKAVSVEQIRQILSCAVQAPSPKNDQPWQFCVVCSVEKRKAISDILRQRLRALKHENEAAGVQRPDIDAAFASADILENASVIIFVYMDTELYDIHDDGVKWDLSAKDIECTHIMSVGASIQNMLLAATDMGIDSLWLGDVFFAYQELSKFIGGKGCMLAAVALGFGNENVGKAPRQELDKKIVWVD